MKKPAECLGEVVDLAPIFVRFASEPHFPTPHRQKLVVLTRNDSASWTPTISLPVTAGPDLTYNGADDAFLANMKAAGTVLD